MSIQSKARRDARKRRLAKARNAPAESPAPAIEAHAELRDAAGTLLGGIVRRDGEWTLGLGGRIVGGSESAARVLAMLKRAAVMHQAEGTRIHLRCSPSLDQAAAAEVAAQGLTFEQFESQLATDLTLSAPADNGGNVRH
ncbi:hypothetical protein [Lysobacter sp. A3-1-A15]|uniref:hypothetical protein n=1 Tax=Novilysobacter viscosus TaxID=3098602 RepID=UPI002ED952F4